MARTKQTCKNATGGYSSFSCQLLRKGAVNNPFCVGTIENLNNKSTIQFLDLHTSVVSMKMTNSMRNRSASSTAPGRHLTTVLPLVNDGRESHYSTLADKVGHSSDGIAPTHPQHRALEVFEILGLLFMQMDPATLALLGDLQENDDDSMGDYKFERCLIQTDWARFEHYARRVRRLTCTYFPLCESAVAEMSRTQMHQCLLPRVHTLSWGAPPKFLSLLSSSTVTNLTLLPYMELDRSASRLLFEAVQTFMPNVRKFDIQIFFPVDEVEGSMVNALGSFKKLEWIIDFEHYPDLIEESPLEFQPFCPILTEGAFPDLQRLYMSVNYRDASRFYGLHYEPSHLSWIYVESDEFEKPPSVYAFLSNIVTAFPLLKDLGLVSSCDKNILQMGVHEEERNASLSFDHLKSLLELMALLSLNIVHHQPLALKDSEVDKFASSWPVIETLLLGAAATAINQSNLTLASLKSFAMRCPKLLQLRIFIDTRECHKLSTGGAAVTSNLLPLCRFSSLKQLDLGFSIISQESVVGTSTFLSQLLPPHCILSSGVVFPLLSDSQGSPSAAFERIHLWKEVSQRLAAM
ncbi:hypothetical protein CPB84DRAFT_1748937 [Gymnopilus junonius]|uniref:Uncharacterized protein n=1 Tax=Gymnopilus junonius TaxID=109634 RepID=A0A9P5NKS3_GYMJU|nr:hypothetical protein CPB84DRAFT_1748937 [Gymnopilus junonius]